MDKLNAQYPTDSIIIGGDFNFTSYEWSDRYVSRFHQQGWNSEFVDFGNAKIIS